MIDFDLYRLIASFCCGSILSISGSLVQGVSQNDLASPSTLGLNALSVLLILFAHITGLFILENGLLVYLPFVLSMVFAICCFKFFNKAEKQDKRRYGNRFDDGISKWVLWGLCFNLFVGAVFSVAQFIFISLNLEFPDQLWFGNFRYVDLGSLACVVAVFVFVLSVIYRHSSNYRAMSFGSDFALGLGIDVKYLQKLAFIISFICVSTVNSFFGVFAFIGLVFPHILRSFPMFSQNFSLELRHGSLLAGFVFMLLDFACYHLTILGAEIPVGMVTSLFGTLILLIFLIKKNQNSDLHEIKV